MRSHVHRPPTRNVVYPIEEKVNRHIGVEERTRHIGDSRWARRFGNASMGHPTHRVSR
jgi:hypothetical protein